MKKAIEILIDYLTCTDPVIKTKWLNLLASFWHKDSGAVVKTIEVDEDGNTSFTFLKGDNTEEFVVIQNFVLPNQMPQSFITGLVDALNSKVDKVTGKGLSANDFTTALKNKLDGLQNYVHPEFHQIGEIEDLPDALESKQDKEAGKALSTNDFTDAYKEQLDNPPVTYERVQDFSSNATIVGAIDGVNTIYDSSQNFEPGTMEIMLNGVDLSIDDDYTETGPNEVTFVEAPETGDKIIFRYQKALA